MLDIKELTWEHHKNAERQAFVKILMSGQIDEKLYATFLYNQLQCYSVLEKYPTVFDEMYLALVSAGETAGLLPKVLERESLLLESLSKIKGQIKSALAYPLAIFFLTSLKFSLQ